MANVRVTIERAGDSHPDCDYIGFSPSANQVPEHPRFLAFLADTERTYKDVTHDLEQRPTAEMIASRIGTIRPPLSTDQLETLGHICVGSRSNSGSQHGHVPGIVDAGSNYAIFRVQPDGWQLVGG